ncbi:MAG: hypothetical protein CMJ23_03510 [Phycisphaerae bacterium]|nr:hypothetical protein [Phycisphaerae bacterium]
MNPRHRHPKSRFRFPATGVALLLIAVTAGSSLTGCATEPSEGWSMKWTHPEQYQSISIPIFTNQTYFQGLERELARAMVTEVESSTPYKVTASGTADTLLRGSIREAELVPLSNSPLTGLPAEMLFKVRIDFEWIDLATGEPIVTRNGFTASAMFTPSRPAMETIDLARFGVVQQLATDLVDVLRDDW